MDCCCPIQQQTRVRRSCHIHSMLSPPQVYCRWMHHTCSSMKVHALGAHLWLGKDAWTLNGGGSENLASALRRPDDQKLIEAHIGP